MTAAEPWVWLARIRRTQGRKGEVFADILTDFPEKFAERKRLWLLSYDGAARSAGAREADVPASCEVELVGHWLHKGGVVLHFAGVDSISDAEKLAGLVVAIPRAERAGLGPDEVYIGDLIGCVLVDVAPRGEAGSAPVVVGEIEDVDTAAGPAPLLVVRGARGEVLVPFAQSYLRRLDVEGKRVEMALPAGLVELNEGE
ncbi:MAG: ribosome maturation factor RimM [Terracidiphilus sp.]|jgi:16S rRNA processing protein RimM